MRDIIVTLIVFGLVPMVMVRPYIGIYLWSWLSYMNPHRLAYGFAYEMPFNMIAGAATFVGILFSKEPKRIPVTPITIVWFLFVFWLSITTIYAFLPEFAVPEWQRTLKIQVFAFLTLMLINDVKKLNTLIWVIVASIGFYGFKGGIFTVATGGSYRVWGPEGSFIEGNNELALALIMILPLMVYLQSQTANKWIKRGLILTVVLCVFSILGSYSRGAFLAIMAMGFMFWMNSQRKVAIGFVVLLLSIVAFTFMPQKWMDRMGTVQTYEEDGSAMGRINAWWMAYNLAVDKPILGGGFNAFTAVKLFNQYAPNPEDLHDAHSIYFEILGEHGFVGLFLFLLLWILTYRNCTWVIRKTKDNDSLSWANKLMNMLKACIVGYAVGGAFLGLAYFDLPYHLIAISVLARIFVEKELAKSKDSEEESASTTNNNSKSIYSFEEHPREK